jgi:hypothetical protein
MREISVAKSNAYVGLPLRGFPDFRMGKRQGSGVAMVDMSKNIDVYVCKPSAGINTKLEAIFIQFEVMDKDSQQGTGKSHTVLMTMPDAMWVLRLLENMQQKYSLPKPTDDIPMAEPSGSKKLN